MKNCSAQVSKAKLDLESMRFQNSEHERRSTILRNHDEVTVGGVLQSLKERHVSAVRYTAIQQKLGTALDFLAGQAERDGENNYQDRMIKVPLKAGDFANVIKEVDKVVREMPRKFTATMGEKPEKTVGFILEILVRVQLPPQRVALMDAMRACKDAGGDLLVSLQTYYAIRDRVVETAGSEQARDGIMAAAGDDGRILYKIIEVAFVPVSPSLVHTLSGDVNEFGVRDVGQALHQGFAAFATAVRLMAKDDVLEMVNDSFELVLNGTELFLTNKARCLGHFDLVVTSGLTSA
jgi:hypothetical protein